MTSNEVENYEDPIALAREALKNPGMLGDCRLAQLAGANAERRVDPAPMPLKVMSDEERETAFLLSYNGDDAGLLWRKANTVREVAQKQAAVERAEQEARNAQSREPNTNLKKMMENECLSLAAGVGLQLSQIVEELERQITELRADVRIANKRAELAELRADLTIAKAHARGEVVEVPEFLERRRA